MTYQMVEQRIRDAVAKAVENGWSVNAIAKEAGVSQSTLSRLMRSKTGGLKPEMLNRLSAYFGMRLTLTKPTKNTGKPKNA